MSHLQTHTIGHNQQCVPYSKQRKKNKNKKRKLNQTGNETDLASFLFDDQPPTKKRRISQSQQHNTNGNKSLHKEVNITWENRVVFAKTVVETLYTKIKSLLSIKMYGFTILDESTLSTFVNNHCDTMVTVHGINLKDLQKPQLLIHGLRASHIQLTAMNASYKISTIFKSNDFQNAFKYNVIANGKQFNDEDKEHWINICNQYQVPPYTLIQQWFKCNKILKHNKFINNLIKYIEQKQVSAYPIDGNKKLQKVIHNETFMDFCSFMSVADCCSFKNEVHKLRNSMQFEKCIYDKFAELLAEFNECGMDINMLTEEEQRKRQKKNKKASKLTPDILFSEGVCVNNIKIHWIDVKNYFIMDRGFMWNKLKKQCKKYNKAFGNGAIVCRGFQSGLMTSCSLASCDVLFLDAYGLC